MPAAKLALKAQRVAARKRSYNKPIQSLTKTDIVKARAAIAAGDKETAKTAVIEATRSLDIAAQKGVLHANNAARRKSRLMKMYNKINLESSSKK
jgi:small subunit ribosomal protein S20